MASVLLMESTCRDLRIVTGRRIRVSWLIFLCELCHLYDLRHQNCQPPLCGEVWGGGATECSAEVLVVSKGSLHMNVDRNSETASFQLRVVNIKIKMPYFPLNDPSRTVFTTCSTNIHKFHFRTPTAFALQIKDLIVESKEVQTSGFSDSDENYKSSLCE